MEFLEKNPLEPRNCTWEAGGGGGGGCIWEKDNGNDDINDENEYMGGRTMKMEMMVVTMTKMMTPMMKMYLGGLIMMMLKTMAMMKMNDCTLGYQNLTMLSEVI